MKYQIDDRTMLRAGDEPKFKQTTVEKKNDNKHSVTDKQNNSSNTSHYEMNDFYNATIVNQMSNFDSVLATSTLNKSDKKQNSSQTIRHSSLKAAEDVLTHQFVEDSREHKVCNRARNINSQVKRLSLSPPEKLVTQVNLRKHALMKKSNSPTLTNSSAESLHWDAVNSDSLADHKTSRQTLDETFDNERGTSSKLDYSVNESFGLLTNKTQRKLPQLPKARKRNLLIRTFSEPGIIRKKITQKFNSTSSLRFAARSFKRKSNDRESTDQPLFPEPLDKKLYAQAKSKGRRGAVISLEINQSVSFVKKPGETDKYCQFSFVPSSMHTHILEEK